MHRGRAGRQVRSGKSGSWVMVCNASWYSIAPQLPATSLSCFTVSFYGCEASYMTHHTRDRGRPPIPGVAASHADSMPQEPPDRTGHDSGQALVRTPPVSGSAIMLAGEGRRKEPRVRFILAAALSRAPHRGPTWPHVCASMLASAGPAHALPGWLERRRLAATGSQILL
jgi:hypothetical protein